MGIFFQILFLGIHGLFQPSVFFFQRIDEVEFPADESLDEWLLNIITAVNGLKKRSRKEVKSPRLKALTEAAYSSSACACFSARSMTA